MAAIVAQDGELLCIVRRQNTTSYVLKFKNVPGS